MAWDLSVTRWSCVTSAAVLAWWLFLAPSLASAHEFWVMPDAFTLKLGQAPTLELRVGAGWPGEARSPEPERTLRWDWVDAAGIRSLRPVPGAPNLSPGTPGWAWVVYRSNHARITLPADAFEAYLREGGLEHVIEARRARGEALMPGKEIYSRCAKALLRVEAATTTTTANAGPSAKSDATLKGATGLSLEILPLSDPHRLADGGALQFALRLNGRPLAGALVKAFAQAGTAAPAPARSDAWGRVTLMLPSAGVWMFNTVHMRPAAASSGADWESLWSSLTLQLGPDTP
jgi:Domain of unknown function (DUF4198)